MSRIDLNIVDRGVQGSEWIAEDVGLTSDHLDDVMEQKTDNSGALNSLPTPFARFFVAREAFRRVTEEHINPEKEAGFAYTQLVSDILDVFELLFNLKYHRNNTWKNGETLVLHEWNSQENLKYIKEKMPILYNSIDGYYSTDINQDKLYFLVYTEDGKDKLLACSSPMTGFVTPPDMDKALVKSDGHSVVSFSGAQYEGLHIRRKSGGEYFRDIKDFKDRDEDFKNYMFNELFSSDNINVLYKELKEYIRSFANDSDIRNNYIIKTTAVKTDQNNELVINGLKLRTCDEIDINSYFTSSIIRVPYLISRENFKTVIYKDDVENRVYDYLLPFKSEVLSLFEGKEIDTDLHINRNSVTVCLRYKGKTYEREYAVEPFRPGMGKIFDLEKSNINFDLGVFPNILSYKEKENNYFKVLVAASNKDSEVPSFNVDKISLSFFSNSNNKFILIKEINPTTSVKFGIKPAVVRSRKDAECSTKFYELYNTSFDVIEVNIMGNTGLIMPVWKISEPTNDTYTYAIDLGTSNTFMSRCKNGENNKPELFNMDVPMVNYLHKTPEDAQLSFAHRIENSIFESARDRIKTEFVPALIDGIEYKFPIRTALCGIKGNVDEPELFDNHNIAFFYEKLMTKDDQDIKTDIKWDKNDALLRIFIRELLLIIKCDILQHNGDLDRTHLVWFRPLSFMGNTRNIYNDIWKEEPANILFVAPEKIDCFSESEAPYYYFKKKDYIKDSDSVTVIDIGGGSTDFVYFKDNKPVMANSVHFGCDVLWENGFIEFDDEKQNGIYKRYADTLRFKRDDLEFLNECFKNVDKVKTKDIINFWLSNAEYCDIKKKLASDFKPVFVYHLTAILFYMASMYKDNNCSAPKTVVFSGNGSKYIDGFICADKKVLKKIVDLVFKFVFGGEHSVNLELPNERKESTCYGGLYRDSEADDVPEKVYQGDVSVSYETIGDINKNFDALKSSLMNKYEVLHKVYKEVLELLKKERIIDNTADTMKYMKSAAEDMGTPLNTYYKSQVKEKYNDEVIYYDSIFFLPIIDRIFGMTKI